MMNLLLQRNNIYGKFWITDTGRNGNTNIRNSPFACQQWCNVKGTLGYLPTSAIFSQIQKKLFSAKLDALLWLKPPGESDGCSGSLCLKADTMCMRECSSVWQKCPAPYAGNWDSKMIEILTAGYTVNDQFPH